MIISVDPVLFTGPRGQFRLTLGPKNGDFFINFKRILRIFWDLVFMLLDSLKDAIFAEILFFCNIFGFPGVNCTPNRTKLVNFGYVPFESK